ncbi:MAG: phage major capsid protein [Eggerthellaceae bacterium]|nr:phage major capsid protein [Eggerthellaceae bacterium]
MFVPMSAEQYRSLSADEFQERKQYITDLLSDPECTVDFAQLRAEAEIIAGEVERRNAATQLRSLNIAAVAGGAGTVIDGQSAINARSNPAAPAASEDPFDTAEYRNAFMEYVCRGTAIPMELRADAHTMTTDVPVQIPTTLMSQIVEKMSEYGNIWNKVTKLNIQGGIEFPVLELKATASWIGEDVVSEYQKLESKTKISFLFHQLECRLSQSILTSVVTFSEFQARFVPIIAEAMVRAIEQSIVRGDGNGQFLGVTKDARVTNVVEMTAEEFGDWKAWRKKVKAAMPKAYRNGEFYMCQSSWDSYVETMSDDQNAPVSIGYNPVTGEEIMRFMGKGAETTEPDIFPDFDTAEAGDVVAVFIDWKNYVVNTNMQIKTEKWIDHETNKVKYKSLMVADGKVLDPYGIILIKKAVSA